MMRSLFLIFALSLGLAQTATADVIVIDVLLEPGQEVPAPILDGFSPSGTAVVGVDTISGFISIIGSYSGMTSDVSAAHLHGLAGIGEVAGVIFPLTVDGGTSGDFFGFNILSSENLSGLLAGQTYINVHTANNGPGEIRGQVAVPEPTTLLLLGVGLAGLGFTRKRLH